MTTPRRRRKSLTERLRAIAGRSDDAPDDAPRSRVHTVSFERSHRDRVWIPPDPPRRWFENHEAGLESMPVPGEKRKWYTWPR